MNSFTLFLSILDSDKLTLPFEQIEYPTNVHLIRGNHEASDINALFGFRIECVERMVYFYTPCIHFIVLKFRATEHSF